MLLVVGDLNARVGLDNTGKERAIGTQGFGHINNNGERHVDMCEENNIVIGYNTVTQIDHVIINKKWRRSLHDVRVRRGADVGSDHMLVMATMYLKLRKARRGEKRQVDVFDVGKLRSPDVEKAFELEVKNRLSILQDEQEFNIDSFNQALTKASKKVENY